MEVKSIDEINDIYSSRDVVLEECILESEDIYYSICLNMSVNIVKQESGSANISVKLRDANTLNAIANANINIKLSDGRSFTVKTDKNANAFLHLDLNAGDNYVNITFDGNYKYNPANASTNLYIPTPKRIVQYNVTLNSLYVGNTSISIKLTDYNNSRILANTPLTFKV